MYKDTRLFNTEKWYHTAPEGANMRLPDEITKSVCFLCVKITGGDNDGKYQVFGTGFHVGINDGEYLFGYLITAKHIIDAAKDKGYTTIYARLNKHSGGVEYIPFDLTADWMVLQDSAIDLAVARFNPNDEVFDFLFLPESMLLSTEQMVKHGVGIGDELAVVGLFTLHHGKKQNFPIARSGIISAMPNEPLLDKKGNPYFAFLAELRSIGGLSGSPVFVYFDNYRVYTPNIEGGNYQFSLLGLIRGHWNLERELADSDLSEDMYLGYSKGEKMNVGIAIVTPAVFILGILNNEQFKEERRNLIMQREQEHYDEHISEDDALDTENFTNDDFQNALKKVSRKISEPVEETKETSE